MRLVRWVPKEYAEAALAAGLKAHNQSALWVFDLDQSYSPGDRIVKNAVLIRYIFDNPKIVEGNFKKETISFESDKFLGEAAHIREIIVKDNEPGVYGLGRTRQHFTNRRVKEVRYATLDETAKALRVKAMETGILDKHKPSSGWGKS